MSNHAMPASYTVLGNPPQHMPGAKPVVFAPEQFQDFANLAEAFYYNATENAQAVAYDQAQRDDLDEHGRRRYLVTSNAQFLQRVRRIAAFLESAGVAHGDAVAVLSLDRPEWTEAEMAIHTIGAHVVSAYVRDAPQRLAHILRDAQVSYAFVENQQQLARVLKLAHGTAGVRLRHLITFEQTPGGPQDDPPVTCLRNILDQDQAVRFEDAFGYRQTTPDDLACIFYTSGSSGQPKGVPVTHRQVLANLHQIAAAEMVENARYNKTPGTQPIVTFLLPERAHVFVARSSQLVAVTPARGRYPAVMDCQRSDINPAFRESVRRDLREGGAGVVLVVPKIAIAIQHRVRQRLAAGGFGKRLASLVVESAAASISRRAGGRRRWSGDLFGELLAPLRHRISGRIRREVVGPAFDYFICGGAKLPLETAAFLWAAGLPIYEGYGTTETNCPIACNTPQRHRLGSVGKLFEGVEARVDPSSGELLVRGPNVAGRYLNSPEETAAVWDAAGWYHTQDVAHWDDDGFLYIDERRDDMLVLDNGENIAPVAIENRFAAITGVETAIVLGHNHAGLVALVVLDEGAVCQWAADNGHELTNPWQSDPTVVTWLRGEVEDKVNRHAEHVFECIRNVAVIEPPTPDGQTLTATEKVRRQQIERKYANLIATLYAERSHWLAPKVQTHADLRRVAAM